MDVNGNDPYAWKQQLPVGIRFRPTCQELILFYLKPKVFGHGIYPGIIGEADIYTLQPYYLSAVAVLHDDGRTYFFTYVKRKDNSTKKFERVVTENGFSIGFWKATQAREKISYELGNRSPVIGYKTPLAYYAYHTDENGETRKIKTNWLMKEYRLVEHQEVEIDGKILALCVIYYRGKLV